MSISSLFRQATQLQERIEVSRTKLEQILDAIRDEVAQRSESVSIHDLIQLSVSPKSRKSTSKASYKLQLKNGKNPVGRPRIKNRLQAVKANVQKSFAAKPSALVRGKKGKKRVASPSGPLAPAVVDVLRSSSKPMNVRSIYETLVENGYQFTTQEPKKNLAARIYRLNGVKQVGEGLFSA